jgi:hypothetical protein
MKKTLKLTNIYIMNLSLKFYILLTFVFLSPVIRAQRHSSQLAGFFISNSEGDTLSYVITPHAENLEILKDTLLFFKITNSFSRAKIGGAIGIRYLSKNKIAIRIPLNPDWKINPEFTDIIPYVAFFYNPSKGMLVPVGINKKYAHSITAFNIPNAEIEVLKFLMNNYLKVL